MPANVHIINKQVFEFECPQSGHAFQMKNKLDDGVRYKIEKIIDRACNQLAVENADIRIPLLEIDLGRISFNNLEEEMLLAFEKKFYEKLSEKKNYHADRNMVLSVKDKSSFEIVKFFLLTGRLPWFAGKQDENYVADLFDEVFATPNDALRRFILSNLNNEKFIERLIAQAGSSHIDRIIQLPGLDEGLVIDTETAIRNIIEEIILLIRRATAKEKEEGQTVFLQGKNIHWLDEAGKFITGYRENNPVAFTIYLRKTALEFILKLVSRKNSITTSEQFYVLFEKMLTEKFEFSQAIVQSISIKEKPYVKDLPDAISRARNKLEMMITAAGEEEPVTQDSDENLKFYISNAGLVLLANYLPVFFKELQLLEQGNFTSRNNQVKAVFLLYYLCTGREEVPEYILPLNKIICGLSLDEPLPSSVSLGNEEKEECEELLNEIINNWQKLGNASIEALREAFINREGILTRVNNGWKLQVERKGHDVLLESLPWSFSHIKLSWMQHLITTEW
jgi:hypothetical protein